MTGSTKILTVSYGTFSCTLEGFDDPLVAMRDMAEYFRDLAADDRYFGAEPPSPDVEMLQRIAEKEVQRRVEARVSETGVALVAAAPEAAAVQETEAEDDSDAEPAEPVAEVKTSEKTADGPEAALDFDDRPSARVFSASGPLTLSDDFVMSDEPENALIIDPDAEPGVSGPAESVAEKLRRIRAVVSRNMEADQTAAREEQAPNSDDPDLRQKALTETIEQIQNDIGYDEDVAPEEGIVGLDASDPSDEAVEDTAEETDAGDEGDAALAADDDEATQPEPFEIPEEEPLDEDAEAFDQPEAVESDATSSEEDQDDADAQAVSDVLRKLSKGTAEEEAEEAKAEEAPATPRAQTRLLNPEPEVDVGRLLDETDTKLQDNDTIRRRRVISQMRAAVAATKADRLVTRQISRETAEEQERTPYRADLNEAVQDPPSKPTARQTSTPPLVLVSSQRVGDEDGPSANGFEAFANGVGATELSELMEAAAAFAIFTEGQSSFTRPEIMSLVTRMDPSLQLTREDSLRSFGQLLRQGTFKKLERGQFTIDEATRFNPAQRASEA